MFDGVAKSLPSCVAAVFLALGKSMFAVVPEIGFTLGDEIFCLAISRIR
jgi:hypothetical protein